MDLYKELAEIAEIGDSVASMFDEILDSYASDKEKAGKLLVELSVIKQEIETLRQDLEKFKDI